MLQILSVFVVMAIITGTLTFTNVAPAMGWLLRPAFIVFMLGLGVICGLLLLGVAIPR
ncbi:MAG: hypothetical protein JWN93_2167 [Hyphomicrobiales bacterium]|nr:hypothetical protein [Hyphomicrobiales bacterium]